MRQRGRTYVARYELPLLFADEPKEACLWQGKLKVAEQLYSESWEGLKRLETHEDALAMDCVEKLAQVLRVRKRFKKD